MEDCLKDLFPDFIEESKDNLQKVHEGLKTFPGLTDVKQKNDCVSEMFRAIHTIKGGCAMLTMEEMKTYAHKFETYLGAFRSKAETISPETLKYVQKCVDKLEAWLNTEVSHYLGNDAEAIKKSGLDSELPALEASSEVVGVEPVSQVQAAPETMTVSESKATPSDVKHDVQSAPNVPASAGVPSEVLRVPLNLVSTSLNSIWEIFLVRNQLGYLFEQGKTYFKDRLDLLQSWENLDSALKRHVSDLEGSLMAMRMTSVKGLFSRMEKTIRVYTDSHSDKVIRFVSSGESIELDKKVCDQLGDPLIHLIRNAMDHGVETTEERVAAGKPKEGTIRLSAEARADRVIIQIQDDGHGIDEIRLLEKAKAKGFDVEPFVKNRSLLDLIFLPGFSTAESVTDVSGRGVGMDVVKHSIQDLNGTIEISTEVGKGTTFTISLPLSLSVIFSTLFKIGTEIFGSNIHSIVEICRIKPEELKWNDGQCFVNFRDQFIPLIDIRNYLLGSKVYGDSHYSLEDEEVSVFVLRVRGELLGVRVGMILHNSEIVVKPLPVLLPRQSFIQGLSILPSGKSIFVLSLDRLLEEILLGRLRPWRSERMPVKEVAHEQAA